MTLIVVALLAEGQILIERYKLLQISSSPKMYGNESILLLISGIGEVNTVKNLEHTYTHFQVTKAINIGIAGCSDRDVSIGELFCTNRVLDGIRFFELKTVSSAQVFEESIKSLYDMEGESFLKVSKKYLDDENIFVFKVVSDHLDDTILPKDKVKKMIQNSLKSWEKWI